MFLFFFKQETAYELLINDWSSDVCSSDLSLQGRHHQQRELALPLAMLQHRHLHRRRHGWEEAGADAEQDRDDRRDGRQHVAEAVGEVQRITLVAAIEDRISKSGASQESSSHPTPATPSVGN